MSRSITKPLVCAVLLLGVPLAERVVAQGDADASDALRLLDRMTRSLDNVELRFVYVDRVGAREEDPAHSHCYRRDVVFSGDGYIIRSEVIDPVVTPEIQIRTGCVMPGGQDLTILYDGAVELYHEDIPETDEDHVIVSPIPTRLGDEDPRQFGLCSLLAHSIEEVRPLGGEVFELSLAGGQVLEVDVDLRRMVCRRITAQNCSGRVVGEYTFSDFVEVDVGDASPPFLYPQRTDLVRYSPTADGAISREVTYLLQDARAVAPVDIAARLRSRPISGHAVVTDRRYAPVVSYRAGEQHSHDELRAVVTFAALGRTYLDRLSRSTASDEESGPALAATAPPSTPPPTTTTTPPGRSRTFEFVGLFLILGGLLWGRRLHRRGGEKVVRPEVPAPAGRSGAGGTVAGVVLVTALSSAAAASAPIELPLRATPTELALDGVLVHDLVREVVSLANDGDAAIELRVTTTAPFLTVWPRRVSLAPGATIDLTLAGAVPSGRPSLEERLRIERIEPVDRVGDAMTALLDVPLRISVTAPVPAAPERDAPVVAPEGDGPRPALVAETLVRHLGRVLDIDESDVSFPFRNDGEAPLTILGVEKDCGCVAADVTRRTIPPGEGGELRVTFLPEAREGAVKRHVYLTTNDPLAPVTTFLIEADVIPSIELSPERLEFGRVAPGDEVTAFLALRFRAGRLPIHRVASKELPVVDFAAVDEENGSTTVAVVLAASVEGVVDGELEVRIEGRDIPFRVPYHLLVRDDVYAEPTRLSLPYVRRAQPEVHAIEFGLLATTAGRISRVEVDDALLSVTAIDAREAEVGRFRVHVKAGTPAGFFQSEIRVHTTWRDTPVVIPVRGFVSEE